MPVSIVVEGCGRRPHLLYSFIWLLSMARPFEPGFSARQAKRFRTAFHRCCAYYGATQADVGNALNDAIENDRLRFRTLWGNFDGIKFVANAMVKSRRLTHRVARRLVIGLLLSKPAIAESDRVAAVGGTDPVPDQAESLLVELGARRLDRPAELPIFLAPRAAEKFAKWIGREAAKEVGVASTLRGRLERGLSKRLRDEAPRMVRAWSDIVLDAYRQGFESISPRELRAFIESLSQSLLREAYIYPTQLSADPEFAEFSKARPDLIFFEVSERAANRNRSLVAVRQKRTIRRRKQ